MEKILVRNKAPDQYVLPIKVSRRANVVSFFILFISLLLPYSTMIYSLLVIILLSTLSNTQSPPDCGGNAALGILPLFSSLNSSAHAQDVWPILIVRHSEQQ